MLIYNINVSMPIHHLSENSQLWQIKISQTDALIFMVITLSGYDKNSIPSLVQTNSNPFPNRPALPFASIKLLLTK